ncbi:unnamed protein product [Trichogramma brassicae]|uniref:Uncharacterized protein n=1 Tax=Trichogramma brassicae TaxID=86971 RepID=A0A6H5IJR2_9HYME|nr:unnamed protein product [Trichogramma brassicae]
MRKLEATTTSTSMLDSTSSSFSSTATNKSPSMMGWILKPTTIRSTAVHLHNTAAKTALHITTDPGRRRASARLARRSSTKPTRTWISRHGGVQGEVTVTTEPSAISAIIGEFFGNINTKDDNDDSALEKLIIKETNEMKAAFNDLPSSTNFSELNRADNPSSQINTEFCLTNRMSVCEKTPIQQPMDSEMYPPTQRIYEYMDESSDDNEISPNTFAEHCSLEINEHKWLRLE